MANAEHYRVVKKGEEALEKWRQENPGVQLDLTWADLRKMNLSGLDLIQADLRWSNLSKANLKGADLRNANLSEANLFETVLIEANLSQAKLNKANLQLSKLSQAILAGADLSGSKLIDTDLNGADLSNTCFHDARLQRVELSNATGCRLTAEQVAENAKIKSANFLSQGHKFILISFLSFLALMAIIAFLSTHTGSQNPGLDRIMSGILIIAFAILYLGVLVGCVYIVIEKGYEGSVGFVLGMSFFLLGLLIVTLLPDRTSNNRKGIFSLTKSQ